MKRLGHLSFPHHPYFSAVWQQLSSKASGTPPASSCHRLFRHSSGLALSEHITKVNEHISS